MIHLNEFADKLMNAEEKAKILREYCRTQFWLPESVRLDPQVQCQKLQILSGRSAFEFLADAQADASVDEKEHVRGDFDLTFLPYIKEVGISLRTFLPTQEKFTLYKLWLPFDPSHLSKHTPSQSKFGALR
jgi:hypothetical protein